MGFKAYKFAAIVLVLIILAAGGCTWEVKTLAVDTPTVARSSLIYDANGNIITHFRGEEHRLVVQNLDEIPTLVQNAVIAIEDERFWEHNGVDLRALLRAARSNINQGGISEGGSTITQQYVGLTFLDRTDRSTSRKIEEISLALQFERLYSKEYILREYLNVIYFGEGAYGIKAAAQEYFDAELNELTVGEAALLAGLIQAPATFNPYSNPTRTLSRRLEVLDGMLVNNWISQKEYDTARTEPLDLKPRVAVLNERYIAPHFVEEVRQWILSDPRFGSTRAERANLLFEGGLHIYTTLDPDLQVIAEAAVSRVLTDPDGPSAAVVVIENDTGYIKAMVGGRDFFGDDEEARFNLATQGGRQAGSAMKPIALASALEQGFEHTDEYYAPPKLDIPLPGGNSNWEIEGVGNNEKINLYEGLIDSVNTVYAQLIEDIGPANFIDMAERLGVKSNLNPNLSIVLGAEDVTTLDMATAFSTFARRGIKVEPTYVTRIAAADGALIYEHNLENTRVLDRNISDLITQAMVEVIERGTGVRAQVSGEVIAGKTGTAENYQDAAFAGFSPKYTIAVWVGFPEAQIAMEPPKTPIQVSGGSYPAEIFQLTMRSLPQDPDRNFNSPTIKPQPPKVAVNGPAYIRLSDVRGLSRVRAVEFLDGFNLLSGIKEVLAENKNDPRIGTVISQEPRGFGLVQSGDLVTLTVVVLPDNCRDLLELAEESDLAAELVIPSNGRAQDRIEENLEVLSIYFDLPSDCEAYKEFLLNTQNAPEEGDASP